MLLTPTMKQPPPPARKTTTHVFFSAERHRAVVLFYIPFMVFLCMYSLNFGQSDYPRTPQDTPGHPRTLQDSIICMFNILFERVDDGLVLVCWCIK